MTQPPANRQDEAVERPWEDVATEVTEAIAAEIEPLIRRTADDIYERIMTGAQDYLAENLRFNLSSRLESAEREAARLRKENYDLNQALSAGAAVREKLVGALKAGRRAIGDHWAPNDCYATGPATGDEYRDLVECPACSFIAEFEALRDAGRL